MIVKIKAYIIDKMFWFHEALAHYHIMMMRYHFRRQREQIELMKYFNERYMEVTGLKDES